MGAEGKMMGAGLELRLKCSGTLVKPKSGVANFCCKTRATHAASVSEKSQGKDEKTVAQTLWNLWPSRYLTQRNGCGLAKAQNNLTFTKLDSDMNIWFNDLRRIKHSLPTGSVSRIANELHIEEQSVRNFFGSRHGGNQPLHGWHLEPGPNGGIVQVEDTTVLDAALRILGEDKAESV